MERGRGSGKGGRDGRVRAPSPHCRTEPPTPWGPVSDHHLCLGKKQNYFPSPPPGTPFTIPPSLPLPHTPSLTMNKEEGLGVKLLPFQSVVLLPHLLQLLLAGRLVEPLVVKLLLSPLTKPGREGGKGRGGEGHGYLSSPFPPSPTPSTPTHSCSAFSLSCSSMALSFSLLLCSICISCL